MAIEVIDIKERPGAWRPNGEMSVGVVAPDVDAAIVILHERHPEMQPVKAFKYGKVFYFPKEGNHEQS